MTTIQDIADRVGVSKTTVSLALSKGLNSRLGKKTVLRIQQEAANMGYQCDDMARAMRTGKMQVIGFVVSELINEHCLYILEGMMEACAKAGYYVRTIKINHNSSAEVIELECRKHRFSGVVCYDIINSDVISQLHFLLAKNDIPLAVATSSHSIGRGINIISNDVMGGRLVFEHLYALGHRRFYIPYIHSTTKWAQDRMAGILAAAEAARLDVDTMIEQFDADIDNSFSLLDRMKTENKPTAVITLSDRSALTVVTSLMQQNYQIADDVSVTGYGNTDISKYCMPALTTIAESQTVVGRRVVELLLAEIELPSGNKPSFTSEIKECYDVTLIKRDSTAVNNNAL